MKYRRSLLKGSLKTINFPCSFFFSDLQFTNCYSSFKLRVEINRKLSWSCFTSLCDWSRKLAPLSQPIRFKPKTNRDLVTHVFPRFKQFACLFLSSHTSLCDWSRKLAPLSQPIRLKPKNQSRLSHSRFPALQAVCLSIF